MFFVVFFYNLHD